jgi:hypothetical protein
MGIHRINWCFIEEFNSAGDLRFRLETDIRMSSSPEGRRRVRRLRRAVESSRHERARDLLLEQLEQPVLKGHKVSQRDLTRVRRLVSGALSNPGKPVPDSPETPRTRRK